MRGPAHLLTRLWLLLLALLAVAATPARAALPPRPDGPVFDGAQVIPAETFRQLDARLTQYNQLTGRAVVVATVASLDGQDVTDYAQKLAESWNIGGKATEEGVLLLVAPTEHKVRIATGRGVQDRLTDALSGRIIRDTMRPRFRAGDYGGGISAAVDEITAQLDRSPADAKAVAEAAAAGAKTGRHGRRGSGVLPAIIWIGVIGLFAALASRRRRLGSSYGGDSGLGTVLMWGALDALSHSGRRSDWGGGGGWGGGDSGGGGFGGFGGGGGGFDGGGASGDW
jgi:uncharacterized protein